MNEHVRHSFDAIENSEANLSGLVSGHSITSKKNPCFCFFRDSRVSERLSGFGVGVEIPKGPCTLIVYIYTHFGLKVGTLGLKYILFGYMDP